MKTSYRIVETFHEGSPILVQRALDTGDGFESYETIGQIDEPVAHATAIVLRSLVCECQDLADSEDHTEKQLKYSDNRERTLREQLGQARCYLKAIREGVKGDSLDREIDALLKTLGA